MSNASVTSLIITVGIDPATSRMLAQRGLEVAEVPASGLGGLLRDHPSAVVLIEGDVSAVDVTGEALKVIQIASPGADSLGVTDALRSHLFGFFRRPFDEELLVETIREAQELQSWSDGIEVLSARPNWLTLRVRCRPYTAERLVRFIRELASDLSADDREHVGTAFREILLNAMEHGAGFDSSKFVCVSYLRTQRFILYGVRDPGAGFSLDDLPHAAISNPPGDPMRHMSHRTERGIRPGGFGLMVTKELVDEMLYNEAGNEVVLIKYV